MKKINLINLDKSDIKYESITFPDGEPHIKLDEIDRKDEYEVICRITNPNELFVLMQVADILDRQAVRWELYITYLILHTFLSIDCFKICSLLCFIGLVHFSIYIV